MITPRYSQMKNFIKGLVPRPVISKVQYTRYAIKDLFLAISGQREPMVPPLRMMFDGPRDISVFKKNGETYLGYFKNLGGLKPGGSILDVGSGIGRKTIPLTGYLNEEGKYEGIDIAKVHVDWCIKNISEKHSNFRFQLIDVYNKHYNPKGTIRASAYKFPFENESFDFVASGSVFTHLVPEDMENYMSEIARVLKRGGRSLITFLLLNKESSECVSQHKGIVDAKYDFGIYRSDNPLTPEDAICIDESFIRGLYSSHGLNIKEPIHYGSWCGRRQFLDEQDIVVAEKPY